jgi:hypothetical protein
MTCPRSAHPVSCSYVAIERSALDLPLWTQVPAGVVAGLGIGVVAAIMGVADSELLIPTIVLMFGSDIKTARSLSLLVSLPTMLVAFARYSRDGSFAVLGANRSFTMIMAAARSLARCRAGCCSGCSRTSPSSSRRP